MNFELQKYCEVELEGDLLLDHEDQFAFNRTSGSANPYSIHQTKFKE